MGLTMFTQEKALAFLSAAGIFFDDDDGMGPQCINLNDTLYWGCADCQQVPDECLVEVASLMWSYGWAGVLYWVMQRRPNERPEFEDVRRWIEFVRQEEAIREREPKPSRRAYLKAVYTIGEQDSTP